MPKRRLRTVLSSWNTDGVSVNAWDSFCCSVGARGWPCSPAWYSGLKSTCSVWTAMTHPLPDWSDAGPAWADGLGCSMIRPARVFMLLVCDVDHDVRFYESDAHKSEVIPMPRRFD